MPASESRESRLQVLRDKGLVGLRELKAESLGDPVFTQGQAALLLGTPRATWQKLEQRKRPMTLDRLGQIKGAFGLEDDEVKALTEWWWSRG